MSLTTACSTNQNNRGEVNLHIGNENKRAQETKINTG